MTPTPFRIAVLPLCLISAFAYAANASEYSTAAQSPAQTEQAELGTVYVTAERQLQQSLGVSRISASDLDKRPVSNDISELVRTMPGVNLTGNTAGGSRGNKRQIDIRGMGPENTLILIDGKPVTSRNNERMARTGERNTRGDSNWVPAEAIESIQVLRGPAAARYGSGAMGGVVNIITKRATNEFKGSVNLYTNQPQDSNEGATKRIGFNLSGPIVKDVLSYRIYGNFNKTDADKPYINGTGFTYRGQPALVAGVEGVRNKDFSGRLHWRVTPAQTLTLDSSFSRQGNIYNGDTLYSSSVSQVTDSLLGSETARLYRRAFSLTHEGTWDWGDTKTYVSYDVSKNSRRPEGLSGSIEGVYSSTSEMADSVLTNYRFNHESYVPFETGRLGHVLTVGAEANHAKLDDASSMRQRIEGNAGGRNARNTDYGTIFGLGSNRSGKASQSEYGLYLEDNISAGADKQLKLIPTLRLDYSSRFGNNWSPALNFQYNLNRNWIMKGGIARAYKAPNLYQSTDNYILYSRGAGCHGLNGGLDCFLLGNSNLKPETSINKEIGLEYRNGGRQASATYFHNAYRDKISAGRTIFGYTSIGNRAAFRWENVGKAVVEGFEGNLVLPLVQDKLKWSNNFTYMRRSINKETGEALSLIPKYTVNSTLAWTPDEKLDANLTYTYYGRQNASVAYADRADASDADYTSVPRYGIMGINAGYKFGKHVDARIGISNLFDKKILRTGNGANSYNEHGRAFYGSLKVNF